MLVSSNAKDNFIFSSNSFYSFSRDCPEFYEAIDIVGEITALREKDIMKIQKLGKRASESATLVLPRLYEQPIVNVATIQKWTGFSRVGAQSVINRFIEMDILTPKDKDKKYGQSYIYKKYVDVFAE